MVESKTQTVNVPTVPTDAPAVLWRAAADVMRIIVRNIGGATLLIAYEATALADLGDAGTFQLPAGASEVFVLTPKQSLLAAAVGIAGQVSIAVSVALPVSTEA